MKTKILLLAGPGGAGKTTVEEMLVERCGYVWLDAESIDSKFFPKGGQWLPENIDILRHAHDLILKRAKEIFATGKSVVMDYIIFGDYVGFIRKFQNEFGDAFEFKVLFPSHQELVKRDKERACWTTGEERIRAVRAEYEQIRKEIGAENYVDTSEQTPEETFAQYFSC